MFKQNFTLFVLLPTLCVAQESGLYLTSDTLIDRQLNAVEVQALHNVPNAPMALNEIDHQQIQRQATAEDAPYLLQSIPSITLSSDAGNGVGYTDIRLRGYDATRINVSIGDVPLNNPESHKVYWVDTPNLLEQTETIQVGRSAGAESAGTGAFGGSIHLQPQKFATQSGGSLQALYGSFNTNKQKINLQSGLLKQHWAIEGSLAHTASEGYIERASSQLLSYNLQTGYISNNTLVRLLLFGGSEHTYNAWDGISKEQMAINRRYNPCGEITDDRGQVIGFYSNQKDNYVQLNQILSLQHQFNKGWSLNTSIHYTYGDGWYDQYKNNRKLAEYQLDSLHDVEGNLLKKSNLTRIKAQRSHFGGLIAYTTFRNHAWNIKMGASATAYKGTHQGMVSSVQKAVDFNGYHQYYNNYNTKNEADAFMKLRYQLIKGLFVNASAQYHYIGLCINGIDDTYNYSSGTMQNLDIQKDYHFINSKLGFSYLHQGHKLYISGAMANHEPTRKDFVNAPIGTEPRPERLYDAELGYQLRNRWVDGGINLYYMWYKDQLVLDGSQNPDTYEALYTNIAQSYRRGIELEINVKPITWLSVGGNLTLSQNKAIDFTENIYNEDTWTMEQYYLGNTNLAYSPSITAALTATFSLKGLQANWITRYVGSQYITNTSNSNQMIDAYWVSNLRIGYEWVLKKGCRIYPSLQINNLFNSAYCSHAFAYSSIIGGQRIDSATYFPQAGINASGSINISF